MPNKICSVEGCDKPLKARTYCKKHYAKWHYRQKCERQWELAAVTNYLDVYTKGD
jgi:hypothetical protein